MQDKSRRRWFRFRLRTLLIVVAIVAVPLAWIAKEQRQSSFEQQFAEKLLAEVRGAVMLGGPFDLWELHNRILWQRQVWWRNAARHILGERILILRLKPGFTEFNSLSALSRVRALSLHVTAPSDLAPLAHLTNLEELIVASTTVLDLSLLRPLAKLRRLSLNHTPVSNLAPLADLPTLEYLAIRGTQVTDITPLAGLTKLRRIDAPAAISREEMESLQKILPHCEIMLDPFP